MSIWFGRPKRAAFCAFARPALVILAGLLLATACNPAQTTTSVPAGTASPGALIEFHRAGGLAGLDDHLIIAADYQASLTRSSGALEFKLDKAQGDDLVQKLEQFGFSAPEVEYFPSNRCCDLIEYAITYKGRTVRTMDTAAPETLQPIIQLLNEIADSHGTP